MANNTQDTFGELRQTFDGSDPFMTGGHQIIKTTGKGRSRGRAPGWTEDEAQFKALLYRAFPKMFSDAKQRLRAGRWARVFYLYFKVGHPANFIAEQMGLSVKAVEDTVRHLRMAGEGRWANGRGKYGGKSRGRPKKIVRVFEHLREEGSKSSSSEGA